MLLILTACSTVYAQTKTSTDPQSVNNYVFVTADFKDTATPFQPALPTEQPFLTETIIPTKEISLSETPTAIDTSPPAISPHPSETPLNLPSQAPQGPTEPTQVFETFDRTQYQLITKIDYSSHRVDVSETILYPNKSQIELSRIALGVNPNLWSGVFTLQNLSINDRVSPDYSLTGQLLMLNLGAPLKQGQTVKISIDYQLTLPYSSAKFENFGYTARQTNLIDWYPFVPPIINNQWVLPDPYAYGENLVYEKADFKVILSFADPDNLPVVAASAPVNIENGTMIYSLPNARNFTISASPEYLVSTADANGVTVNNYYFASNSNAAAMVLDMTKMSVITYSSEFGPYPHSTISVCETDLNDGLETDGLYFLASSFYRGFDGTVKNNLSTIAIHETAHQWWYGAVANNQANEPWLDEAMATYSEHIFFEDNYPELLNWWWNFRINSHGANGWVDSRVYDTKTFSSYVSAVYFNGAMFLQDLRDRIGDEAFFAFIRDYFARNDGQIVSADVFFADLALHTDLDISDLIKSYFYYR